MKKLLIATILILFSSSTFANPDGKGLICNCSYEKCSVDTRTRGHFFYDGKVTNYNFYEKNTEIKINENGGKGISYYLTTDFIGWRSHFDYKLDRESLILTKSEAKENITVSKCKIILDKSLFLKEIERLKNYYQDEINLTLKKNKI